MLQVDRHTARVEMAYSVRKCNWFELESPDSETKDRAAQTSGDKNRSRIGRALNAQETGRSAPSAAVSLRRF